MGGPSPNILLCCAPLVQLVWEGTTQVGCGLADCGDQGIKVVCSYNSPGEHKAHMAAVVLVAMASGCFLCPVREFSVC